MGLCCEGSSSGESCVDDLPSKKVLELEVAHPTWSVFDAVTALGPPSSPHAFRPRRSQHSRYYYSDSIMSVPLQAS